MSRPFVIMLWMVSILGLTGCGSVSNFQVFPPQTLEDLGLSDTTALAVAPDQSLVLTTDQSILRIHPRKHTVETLFAGDADNLLRGVAVSRGGVIYVSDRERLRLFAGTQLHDLLESSDAAHRLLLSCQGESDLYLRSQSLSGEPATLFHYNTRTKEITGIAEFDQDIHAIAGVRGGCLIATDDSIYKIFKPDGGADELVSLMVCSVVAPERRIMSLAVDEPKRAVYFATQDGTWAYVDGQVVPILPVGGQLAFAGDVLTIWDGLSGQLLQVKGPAQRARQALKAMLSQS